MIEKIFAFANDNEKKIEKIIDDQAVMINHMIFPEGEGLKEHYSNSNVYMIVLKGTVTLQLGDQELALLGFRGDGQAPDLRAQRRKGRVRALAVGHQRAP